ncbi:hypothetical protein ACQBAU_16330 [Propionibacteriaceae bacterium Y2011]
MPTPRKTTARKATNPVKPKSQVVEQHLHFRTNDGDTIRMPLNIKLDLLEELLELNDKLDDPREGFALITRVIGADASKVGLLDLGELIGAWSDALGRSFAGALGNSLPSLN